MPDLHHLYPDGRLNLAGARQLLSDVDCRQSLGTTLGLCVQVSSALPMLHAPGSGSAVGKTLEAALRGESVVALAATDTAAAGSDLTSLGTTADITDDQVVVNGGKRWIVNATNADYFIVLARHRAGTHFTHFTTVLIPGRSAGVTVTATDTRLFDGAGLGTIRLDRVRVNRGHLIGRAGQGLALFARAMVTERLVGGMWAAAMLRRVLREARPRLQWDREHIRYRFARCVLAQRRLDALALAADDSAHALVVKAAAAEAVDQVLTECAAFGGADAFGTGGLHELRAAGAMWGVAGGSTDTMLAAIADHERQLLEPL